MSLPVSLSVRLGDRHITQHVQDVAFRKEAVGGLRSITFKLARSIATIDADMAPFTKVYLYDGRSAETVAEGRLSDSGRTADTSGQAWDMVAFGPAQHPSDIAGPLIYVDTSVSDGWSQVDRPLRAKPSIGPGSAPGDASAIPVQGVVATFQEAEWVPPLDRASFEYRRIWDAGQKLARIRLNWDAGLTDANWSLNVVTGVAGSNAGNAASPTANVAGGSVSAVVVTDWPSGRDTCRLEFVWTAAAAAAAAWAWAFWYNVTIRAMLMDKSGADITTGYAGNYVLASEVVADLLGRRLPEFDGANATVAATSGGIFQLTYPDGVTAAQVLDDMMTQEPAYRWYTTPDTTGNGYGFRWELWPTAVRYEVTLDDGGSFPLTAQDLYNQVIVRYKDIDGMTRSVTRTRACVILDNAGITRRAMIDLGGEVGNLANAQAAGDTFLAEHNVPKNSGTVKVNRPIRDLITGRMVEPFEIEAGELIRVRGVESYADSLNADSNDGQTVFRIFAMDYTSSDNSANLSLDADPTDVASILAKLLTDRKRT